MNIKYKLLFIFMCVIYTGNALSDVVFLSNGDRLSGAVINKTEKVLMFRTEFAGEIEINWDKVEQLSTDTYIEVVLNDETHIKGTLLLNEESEQLIDVSGKSVELKLEQVAVINPPETPKFHTKGQVNFGMEIDRGNTDEDDYHLDAEAVLRWPVDRLTFMFEGDYEESDGSASKQEAKFLTDYDHFITEKFYATAGTLLEHDKFADLELRTTINAGVGYQLIENNRTNLSIEGSPGYLWEDFDESDDQDYPIALWRLKFDHYLFEKWKLQAFHNHRFTQSLEDGSDYIFLSRSGLRIPLYENFQATIQYNFERDNDPADDADKDDRETLITAGYKW